MWSPVLLRYTGRGEGPRVTGAGVGTGAVGTEELWGQRSGREACGDKTNSWRACGGGLAGAAATRGEKRQLAGSRGNSRGASSGIDVGSAAHGEQRDKRHCRVGNVMYEVGKISLYLEIFYDQVFGCFRYHSSVSLEKGGM